MGREGSEWDPVYSIHTHRREEERKALAIHIARRGASEKWATTARASTHARKGENPKSSSLPPSTFVQFFFSSQSGGPEEKGDPPGKRGRGEISRAGLSGGGGGTTAEEEEEGAPTPGGERGK